MPPLRRQDLPVVVLVHLKALGALDGPCRFHARLDDQVPEVSLENLVCARLKRLNDLNVDRMPS